MSVLPLTFAKQNKASATDTKKRRNLMSIVDSLHPSTTSNRDAGSAPDSFSSDSETVSSDAYFPPQQESDLNAEANVLQEAPRGKDEGDVVTNILKLLYQVASSDPIETPQPQSSAPVITPHENDESILEMQNAPQGSKSGILNLIKCYKSGTSEVKAILDNDVNFLYECKRCRGIFRSLPSLIKHKREFCKNSGLYSSFMNRSSNSTAEEDATFQKVLNILHPAENTYFDKMPEFPAPQPQPKESNLKNPPALNIGASVVRMTTPSVVMSPVVYESTSSPATSSSGSTSSTSSNQFGKFYVGQHDKKFSCPTCGKAMVERKNIRRHLVNVHRMRVYDAIKLMNNCKELNAPPKQPLSKSRVMSKSLRKPDSEVLDQCVETIKLGPNRVIHVLSESYNLSSAKCPVCNRDFCRRTNVRRHILEAHNLIIKGEKKYFQLKDIASKNISSSPSLRALRYMFVSSNSTGTDTVSSTKSSIISKPQTSTVTTSTTQQVKPVAILPLPSTTISKVRENGGYFTIDKVKFVTTSQTTPSSKQLPTSVPKTGSTAGKVAVGTHDQTAKNKDLETLAKLAKNLDSGKQEGSQSQDVSYNPAIWCPKCNTTLKYVSSFKAHMTNVHSYSEKDYVQLLKEMNIPDPTFGTLTRRRSSDETEDDPPPKKLRDLAPPSESTKQTSSTEPQSVVNGYGEKGTLKSHTPPQESDSSITGSSVTPSPLLLRRFSPGTQPVTTSSPGLRPFIKVQVKNPNVSSLRDTNKYTTSFNFKKLICYSCDKRFLSAPDMKRHLLGVHSFTVEDALAACCDSSDVSEEVQNEALHLGFDIILAKCLICQKLYFSREYLYRHMNKFHHMEEEALAGLKNSFAPSDEKSFSGKKAVTSPKVPLKSTTTVKTVTITTQPIGFESATPKSKAPEKSPKREPVEASPASRSLSSPYSIPQRPKSISGNIWEISEEDAEEALKIFPKKYVNANTLRCMKCKHKYQKAWDLKVHVLKHLDLGLLACKFCPKSETKFFSRPAPLLKHFHEDHRLRTRNKDSCLSQCRVDHDKLWEAYDLPTRKANGRC